MNDTKKQTGARTKRRRFIYNDDGGGMKHIKDPDLGCYFAKRLEGHLRRDSIDTVFFCGHDDWAKVFYDSAVEGVAFNCDAPVRALLDGGIDPMQATIDYCRERGREIFYSFRMNDIHDSVTGDIGPWKQDHPEWLIGTRDALRSKHPDGRLTIQACLWASMDFTVPEARRHIARCIEEVMERWDWDGFEFDYSRNASLFKSTYRERHATDAERDVLTAFQRELSEMARTRSAPSGQPCLVAAVIPETVALSNYVGIDIETWLREGLLDMIIAGDGYVPFSPGATELVALGHRYGTPVYIRTNANGDRDRPFHHHPEAWRAAAYNHWTAGADGLYIFNTYDSKMFERDGADILAEMGDPERLRFLDKLYLVHWNHEFVRYGYGDIYYYMPHENMLPMPLAREDRRVEFVCLEDLEGAVATGRTPEITLRLGVENVDPGGVCSFTLNDTALPEPCNMTESDSERVFQYALAPHHVIRGTNTIRVGRCPKSRSDAAAALTRGELWIRYGNQTFA
ncbi:MAG: family 10 glycosylhydrolase [Planctomycetota bacterium]